MENKENKSMKYSEILANIDDIFDFFKFHNRNLTNKQYQYLLDLQDLVHELRKYTK